MTMGDKAVAILDQVEGENGKTLAGKRVPIKNGNDENSSDEKK